MQREPAAHTLTRTLSSRDRRRQALLYATPQCRMAPSLVSVDGHHARVFEGVAKSHFLLKALVFKSQKRGSLRFSLNEPPQTLWRGSETVRSHCDVLNETSLFCPPGHKAARKSCSRWKSAIMRGLQPCGLPEQFLYIHNVTAHLCHCLSTATRQSPCCRADAANQASSRTFSRRAAPPCFRERIY